MCESFSFCFSGAPRVATAIVKLPLKLIVKPVLPVKTAEYKLTLDTNKPPANLNEIFPGKELVNKNYRLDIAEKLLKVALNTITLSLIKT